MFEINSVLAITPYSSGKLTENFCQLKSRAQIEASDARKKDSEIAAAIMTKQYQSAGSWLYSLNNKFQIHHSDSFVV